MYPDATKKAFLSDTLKSIDVEEYIKANEIGTNDLVEYIIDMAENEMLKLFIKYGLDLTRKIGDENVSILAYSLLKHNPTAFDILIDAHAFMDATYFFLFLSTPQNLRHHYLKHYFKQVNVNTIVYIPNMFLNGCNPLHLAVMYNEPSFVNILIERNMDINCRNYRESWTLLKYMLNIKNQYLFIKLSYSKELTKIHQLFVEKNPNMIVIFKCLLNNGIQIAFDFPQCSTVENIMQYVFGQNHIREYLEILHILLHYARREFINEHNNNDELKYFISDNIDLKHYYDICITDLKEIDTKIIHNLNISYI